MTPLWLIAALAGWRALFLTLFAAPAGAVVLLCIARLTGARWQATLLPLARLIPWLLAGFVPVIVGQALCVTPPPHLALWLWWPLFALRGFAAIGLWWWLARATARARLSEAGAALGLLGHALLMPPIASDWILGLAPGQPYSAAPMLLAASEILSACAAACLLAPGPAAVRRDLARLGFAAALGVAYLMFVDYLIVWYGNLPQRAGFYVARSILPWGAPPVLAILLGIAAPVAALSAPRLAARERWAGGGFLAGLALAFGWLLVPGAAR